MPLSVTEHDRALAPVVLCRLEQEAREIYAIIGATSYETTCAVESEYGDAGRLERMFIASAVANSLLHLLADEALSSNITDGGIRVTRDRLERLADEVMGWIGGQLRVPPGPYLCDPSMIAMATDLVAGLRVLGT